MDTMPVIIRDLTDEEAVITMVDSNLQREHILPSEKAFAYKMKMEALSHQGKTSRQVGERWSVSQISEAGTDSERQIHRYIRLTHLIPDILKLVDEGKIALTPAVELSYLQPSEQEMLFSVMDSDEVTPSLSQARRLRRMSEAQTLTDDAVLQLLSEVKGNQVEYVKVPVDKLRSFFRPGHLREADDRDTCQGHGLLQQTLGAAAQRPGRPVKGDFTMKEIIKEIIEFDLDEGRMDYLDDMIDVFSKDGCEMVDILFDRFLKKYYADIDVSNERMTINLTDEEGHVLSFNLSPKARSIMCFTWSKEGSTALCATTEEVVSVTKTELQTMYEVMFTDYPDIVNVAQVQSMLKISRHLAYELIGDGYIPGMKIGNAYRIPKINVIRYALSAGNPQPAA